MKIYLISDHAGFKIKEKLKNFANKNGHDCVDLGPKNDDDPKSYVSQGKEIGTVVAKDSGAIGIAVCGTGIGISIAANKVKGIRAARVTSLEDAKFAKEHNDANVLAVGGRQLTEKKANKILEKFISSSFEGGRHIERIKELNK